MKKANLIFAGLTLIFMGCGIYLNNYADGGTDGLSNFFLLLLVLLFILGSTIAFFVSLYLQKETSRFRKTVLTLIALTVIGGFLASIGLFGFTTPDVEVEVQERTE